MFTENISPNSNNQNFEKYFFLLLLLVLKYQQTNVLGETIEMCGKVCGV